VTEVVGYLKRYAGASGAPVHARTKVTRVRQVDGGYEVCNRPGSVAVSDARPCKRRL